MKRGLRIVLSGAAAALPLLLGLNAGAQAQQAPGSGSFPGSFLVPGTNTSLKIGGYVKADFFYDHSVHQDFGGNGAGTAPVPQGIALDANVPGSTAGAGHGIHGVSQLSAAESRFNIETRTLTAYGEFSTFIEGDFEGVHGVTPSNTFQVNSNRSAFALRHAYGTFGPLLAGQTFSTFEDIPATPETLDFGGEIAAAGPLRVSMFRYTYVGAEGLRVAVAVENPQTEFYNTTLSGTNQPTNAPTTFSLGQGNKIPDFVGNVTWNQAFGHLAFRWVARELYDHNPASNPNFFPQENNAALAANGNTGTNVASLNPAASASKFGWGLGLSGRINTWGKDRFQFQVNGGPGIGHYSTNTGAAPGDSVIAPPGTGTTVSTDLRTITIWDAVIGYQHHWTETLRSNVSGSIMKIYYPHELFSTASRTVFNGAFAGLNKELDSAHANLIWSPIPAIDLGVEFLYLQRKTNFGQRGEIDRTIASAKFKF
jgi:hypothetical protein